MRRLLAFVFFAFSICGNVYAQKKELAQARTYIKNGTNLDKAEASMRSLLKDSTNKKNIKIWLALTDAVKKQYEQGNEKLYLKQKYDTTALFVIGRRMFNDYESMDSIDALPNKKGRVEPKYRKRNSEYLNIYRKNLFNGGLFLIAKQRYKDAFAMFDSYIDCIYQPLFSDMNYDANAELILKAAYLATYCGVMFQDNDMALKYQEKAQAYIPGREKTLQYLANIWKEKGEIGLYCSTLKKGFHDFPKSDYFFTRLVDFYNNKNQTDSAMTIVELALSNDSTNSLYLYAKANILLNIGEYENCAQICNEIISKKDPVEDVYYTAGLAYLNLAFEAEKNLGRKDKIRARSFYKKALPYMEKYRGLVPEQKDKWASALYNIYLNLNMGKKFEEISAILQEYH